MGRARRLSPDATKALGAAKSTAAAAMLRLKRRTKTMALEDIATEREGRFAFVLDAEKETVMPHAVRVNCISSRNPIPSARLQKEVMISSIGEMFGSTMKEVESKVGGIQTDEEEDKRRQTIKIHGYEPYSNQDEVTEYISRVFGEIDSTKNMVMDGFGPKPVCFEFHAMPQKIAFLKNLNGEDPKDQNEGNSRVDGKFNINKDNITRMDLGYTGDVIQEAWKKELPGWAQIYNKEAGVWNMRQDIDIARAWAASIAGNSITEGLQDDFTCDSPIAFVRLDRVYSSLQAAHSITSAIRCYTLEKPIRLSDHKPLRAEFACLCKQSSGAERPFKQLELFKAAAKRVAKLIKHRYKNHEAATNDEKLSACVGFLRALQRGDVQSAARLQLVYGRLRGMHLSSLTPASAELRGLLDHVSELSQASIQARVDELKQVKEPLPDHIYKRRKDNILRSLEQLLPGSSGLISAIVDPVTGMVVNAPSDVAAPLTSHWQTTFDGRETDQNLRAQWLQRLNEPLRVPLHTLSPKKADVVDVLENLPSSGAGPDGVPFEVYKLLRSLVAPIFLNITNALTDGSDCPPDDFNYAFLVCIPKRDGELLTDGTSAHEANNTSPLSIVDASNRMIASMFRVALERCHGSWVLRFQRGFLQGRHMSRNALEVDFAAQKISIRSKSGAILLFDFRAAFPSISHDFMFDALHAVGLPDTFVEMLQLFYKHDHHVIRIGDQVFPSIVVRSCVRQGCPLSPLLFALCADILLRETSKHLSGDEALCAVEDDTAAVVADYVRPLPTLSKLFQEFESISALAICPLWKDILVRTAGKYLGFMIGPGSANTS
ncbi:unnamed protein product [Polarella glacialis]|uniref:Reverse transcriptase domain-containing protein n=1 Tax=Polarella glacialis TaxID=89957 RepID=A0A813D9Y0_POLGL|nr:unnamed protein product [Polarella glacialis]